MRSDAVLLLLLSSLLYANATVYSRCGLANALLQYSNVFPRAQLADWVCLVEHESSRDTSKVGGPNSNGSYDYGLFQINSVYWCGLNGPGGDCNLSCKSLTGDDGLAVAVNCVNLIYKRHGFTAWYGWINGCQGKPLPNLASECGI